MKRLLIIALAATAMLSVSCKKDNFTDNTFTLGKTDMAIDFTATVGEDDRYTAAITFTGAERPLYYDFAVENIVISARLCSTELPAYQYFAWDFYEFESGNVKSYVKDGKLTLILDAKLSNGSKVKVRAKTKVK